MLVFKSLLLLFLIHQSKALRAIIFVNNCKFPLWISPRSNPDAKSVIPTTDIRKLGPGGASTTYDISDAGWAGRFWPKAKCDSKGQNCGIGQSEPPCPSKGCSPPAETLVEFYFGKKGDKSAAGENFYDISLVDGYSFSARVTPEARFGFPSCTEVRCRLGIRDCPTNENDNIGSLRLSSGQCLAPCKKVTSNKPNGFGESIKSERGQAYCCPTPPVTVEQCRNGKVVKSKYVATVQGKCKTAYSYAYDDVNALHKCRNDVGFTVTYCF